MSICGLVDFWRSKVNIYSTPKTLYKPTLTPANLQLAYYFYTMQYHPNPSQKPCNFIRKYDPFTPNDYFPLAISPNITRLLYLLAILAYPVLQQKHTSLPILQRRHRKNRESTLHFTRELFCYTICYPHFLSGKTRLT
jgi:hypothetical protein